MFKQIGNVPEINAVKRDLERLTERGIVKEWELPYEELLTRLKAALFFFTPSDEQVLEEISKVLNLHGAFRYRPNEEKKLSRLAWRAECA